MTDLSDHQGPRRTLLARAGKASVIPALPPAAKAEWLRDQAGVPEPYEFLNWACKFSVDANLMELAVRRHEEPNAC